MNIVYKLDKQLKLIESFKKPLTVTVNSFDTEAIIKFRTEIDQAMESTQEIIPIVIDSYGGAVHGLLAMVDIINNCPKTIATIGTGKSMSAGAILLSCGTKGYRYCTKNNTVMLHDVASGSWGKIEEMKVDVKEAERLNECLFDLLDTNCGKKPGFFKKKYDEHHHADWFLTAEEALELGLVDKIGFPHFTIKTKLSIEFED